MADIHANDAPRVTWGDFAVNVVISFGSLYAAGYTYKEMERNVQGFLAALFVVVAVVGFAMAIEKFRLLTKTKKEGVSDGHGHHFG